MELKLTNPNGEIILARKLNYVKLFFWQIVKITFKNESYKLFFQEARCLDCTKNKTIYNIHIIQLSKWNESKFFFVDKYIIDEKEMQ